MKILSRWTLYYVTDVIVTLGMLYLQATKDPVVTFLLIGSVPWLGKLFFWAVYNHHPSHRPGGEK